MPDYFLSGAAFLAVFLAAAFLRAGAFFAAVFFFAVAITFVSKDVNEVTQLKNSNKRKQVQQIGHAENYPSTTVFGNRVGQKLELSGNTKKTDMKKGSL